MEIQSETQVMPLDEIQQLSMRLRALEWVFYQWQDMIRPKQIPAGLFRVPAGGQLPVVYFKDVQRDLERLKSIKDINSARYLAQKIRHKINILVYLYQTQTQKQYINYTTTPTQFCTRKQWLSDIEDKVKQLEAQRNSVQMLYQQAVHQAETHKTMQFQNHLSEIEQYLQELKKVI